MAVMRVVNDPTSNVTVALLMLAGVTLVVLLLVSLVSAFAMPPAKKVVKVRATPVPPMRSLRQGALGGASCAASGAAKGRPRARPRSHSSPRPSSSPSGGCCSVSAYGITSTDAYCAQTCHGERWR